MKQLSKLTDGLIAVSLLIAVIIANYIVNVNKASQQEYYNFMLLIITLSLIKLAYMTKHE